MFHTPEKEQVCSRHARLASWLKISIVMTFVLSTAGIVSNWWEIQFIEDLLTGRFSNPDQVLFLSASSDYRQGVIGLLQLFVHAAVWIFFLRWLYWSSRCVESLGAKEMTFTPTRAVGTFLLPIFNLWRPYIAINELLRASRSPRRWKTVHNGATLLLWWMVCLAALYCAYVAIMLSLQPNGLPQLIQVNVTSVSLQMLAIIIYYGMYLIVSEVERAQSAENLRQETILQL